VGGAFICYRRDDTGDVAGRLYDRLVARLGRERVFKDVFSIELGRDFDAAIRDALRTTDVVLVLIGDRWNPSRLASPDDSVRKEIEHAIALDLRIIPVFIRGARAPAAHDLPKFVARLATSNGMPLRDDPDFDHDVRRLLASLRGKSERRRLLPIALAVGAAISLLAGGAWLWRAHRTRQLSAAALALFKMRFPAPVCAVDEGGNVSFCSYLNSDACLFSMKRLHLSSKCVARPNEVYCEKPDSDVIRDVDAAPCFTSRDGCHGDCTPIDLGDTAFQYSATEPPSEAELELVRAHNTMAYCVLHQPEQQVQSCSFDTKDDCDTYLRGFAGGNYGVCRQRPTSLVCAPGPMVGTNGRMLECFFDDDQCHAAAMPGARCARVELIAPSDGGVDAPAKPPSNGSAAPNRVSTTDDRIRVSVKAPKVTGIPAAGNYCGINPGTPLTRIHWNDIARCFKTRGECAASYHDGCLSLSTFWCDAEYHRDSHGTETATFNVCSTFEPSCESRRKMMVPDAHPDAASGLVAISDRCYPVQNE
jgi:hypothetical protein